MVAIDLCVAPVGRFSQGADLGTAGNAAEKTQRVARGTRVGEPRPMFVTELDVPALLAAHILTAWQLIRIDASRAPFSPTVSDGLDYRGCGIARAICVRPHASASRRASF